MNLTQTHLVIIGSSAGGPPALYELLKNMGQLDACVIVVQHQPHYLTDSLVQSFQRQTSMTCIAAKNGIMLQSGLIVIAPGDYHLKIDAKGTTTIDQSDFVNYVRPAVDVTMKSVAAKQFASVTGIILTGLGKDGSSGIVHLKKLGATIIAQDRASSAVYGMPRMAAETGAVDQILSLTQIAEYLAKRFNMPLTVKN